MGDEDWKVRILVLDRGFVIACRCPDPVTVGLWLPARDCRVVRRWGTTRGLGELAAGPTESTVLDDLVSSESYPVRAVIRVLEVDQSQWEPHLASAGSAGPKPGRRRAASGS